MDAARSASPRTGGALPAAATAAGALLAAVFRAVGAARRDRALHPRGATFGAVVTTTGSGASGVPWLDQAASTEVTLRVSRATGLPAPLPDIHGIALRVPGQALGKDGPADLLFAGTGDSSLGRFVLAPRLRADGGPLTTLLPYRSPRGPLELRLVPHGGPRHDGPVPAGFTLSYAIGSGQWRDVGEVVVGAALPESVDRVRHDPVLNLLPGTSQYGVVSRLREPSYRAARSVPARSRGAGRQ
jgi:hypothetical protein